MKAACVGAKLHADLKIGDPQRPLRWRMMITFTDRVIWVYAWTGFLWGTPIS
jgi:hypothetical protein